MKVFVFINTELEKESEVSKKLRGTWSVARARNLNQIYKIIKRIEGVQSATTMIVVGGKR